MHSNKVNEEELVRRMKRLTTPYRQAVEILRSYTDVVVSADNKNAPTVAEMTPRQKTQLILSNLDIYARLKPALDLITRYEKDVQPLRLQWNTSQQPAGPELKQLTELHRGLLKELVHLLDGVEARMKTTHATVEPHANKTAKHLAMRRAYQASGERR